MLGITGRNNTMTLISREDLITRTKDPQSRCSINLNISDFQLGMFTDSDLFVSSLTWLGETEFYIDLDRGHCN